MTVTSSDAGFVRAMEAQFAAERLFGIAKREDWGDVMDAYQRACEWLAEAANRAGAEVPIVPNGGNVRVVSTHLSHILAGSREEAHAISDRWQSVQDEVDEHLRQAALIARQAVGEATFQSDGPRLLTEMLLRRLPARVHLDSLEDADDDEYEQDDDEPLSDGKTAMTSQHRKVHRIADVQGWACLYCGIELIDICSDDDVLLDVHGKRYANPDSGKRLPTIDHLLPRAMGGSNRPENLGLACQPCNSRKGAS